jgi:hypothetical protein
VYEMCIIIIIIVVVIIIGISIIKLLPQLKKISTPNVRIPGCVYDWAKVTDFK